MINFASAARRLLLLAPALALASLLASTPGCEAKLAGDPGRAAGNGDSSSFGGAVQGGSPAGGAPASGGMTATGSGGTAPAGTSGTSGLGVGGGTIGIACDATHGLCNGACVATADDNLNCGACGKTCAAGTACAGGQCLCSGGALACSEGCVDGSSNAQHCGQCSTVCGTGQTCASGSCACPAGQTLCNGACLDTSNDPAHCGTCSSACSTGQVCTSSSCQCQAGLTSCSGTCVDVTSAVTHCGSCTNSCPSGNVCSNGSCALSCAAGLSACNGSCVNVATDVANCGACGTSCPAGQTCGSGKCQCPSGQALCNGACVDTTSNFSNCGACNKACASGQTCQSSQCACPGGQALCGSQCVNTQSDSANCGACGTTCGGGRSCMSGACACTTAGQTFCNNTCVNTKGDANNCGACGKVCGSGQVCTNGACGCPSGQTLCSGQCVDTTSSAGNCGSCGHACAAGATCSASTCSGGSTTGGKVFSQCRFHFGAIDTFATKNNLAAQLDYFTPGWMGSSDTFDQSTVCTEAKGALVNQVPVIVAYVAAFYAKRHAGLCDCNVTTCGTNNDLCHNGAAYIQQNLASILNVYKSYAQGYASCYGTTKPIVFEMEPDFYQYTSSTESSPWSNATAASIMKQFVTTIKTALPNAVFSMDISPWVGQNGADNGAAWYGNFDMTMFTFINTSGGSTDATSTKIRSSNGMTWAGVSAATGKPILADTGYGVNGSSSGPDANWDSVTNINLRMKDGVSAICQYNPSTSWATTISGIRSQLGTPKFCP